MRLHPSFAGASLLIAEGTPDFPDTGRFWRLIQDTVVSYLGVSPTIIRSLMRYGPEEVEPYDLSSLRITLQAAKPGPRRPGCGSSSMSASPGFRSSTSPAGPRSAAAFS